MKTELKLGDKIRYIRKSKLLTQKNFGKMIGIADSTIALWESDKRTPDITNLYNISTIFNVSIDWLLSPDDKNILIKIPKTENTITIIGRNGDSNTYIVDDYKKKAIQSFVDTMDKIK